MLRLAVLDHPDLLVDDRELHREGPSWMVDTLTEIRAEAADSPLLLVIGQDSANQLDHWHRWQELFGLAHIVVMERPGAGHAYSGQLAAEMDSRDTDDRDALVSHKCGRVMHLQITQLAISSTEIRQALKTGKSPRFLLPDRVLAYLQEKRLYVE
jgi:nicotinate-nucleotide adenylyltransferase